MITLNLPEDIFEAIWEHVAGEVKWFLENDCQPELKQWQPAVKEFWNAAPTPDHKEETADLLNKVNAAVVNEVRVDWQTSGTGFLITQRTYYTAIAYFNGQEIACRSGYDQEEVAEKIADDIRDAGYVWRTV